MRIIIIIPYFGVFPNYFNLWLKSVRFNSAINWLLITDNNCDKYKMPDNIKVLNLSFSELKQRIQDCFDFRISLESAYKLCDFRPAYGYIFGQETEGYDFWGYGDLDVIYGDLRKVISDDKLTSYDRILVSGHLSIIRNNCFMNNLFMKRVEGCFYYKDVFASKASFTFDEWGQKRGGYYQICEYEKVNMFNQKEYADIDFKNNRLCCDYGGDIKTRKIEYKKKHVRFMFDKGKLYELWGKRYMDSKDVCYIHLQKRAMQENYITGDKFYIYPHSFSENLRKSRIFEDKGLQKSYIKMRFKSLLRKLKIIK